MSAYLYTVGEEQGISYLMFVSSTTEGVSECHDTLESFRVSRLRQMNLVPVKEIN